MSNVGDGRRMYELSSYTAAAVQHMCKGKPGDKIPLEEMNKIVGRPCDSKSPGYRNVTYAIYYTEVNYNVTWRWFPEEKAWVCLDSKGRLKVLNRGSKRIHKFSKRMMRIAVGTDRSEMSPEERLELNIRTAQMGMESLLSSGGFHNKAQRLLSQDGRTRLRQIEPSKLLELMKDT
jgi:hypothetical protein